MAHWNRVRVSRGWLFVLMVCPLGYSGFVVGFACAYYLGDHGDVGSAFVAVLTCPIGILVGIIGSAFAADWLTNKPNQA